MASVDKLILQSWRDSNMARDSWSWEIFLTRRKDGSWSVHARQDIGGSPPTSFRLRGIYRIRTGLKIKEAIESLFLSDSLVDVSPDWALIESNIQRIDGQLATQLHDALLEQDVSDDEEMVAEDAEASRIANWLSKSAWQRSRATGAGGIVAGIDNARRYQAVKQYASKILSLTGSLPTGEHHLNEVIVVTQKPGGFGDGTSRAFADHSPIQLTVNFPDQVDS